MDEDKIPEDPYVFGIRKDRSVYEVIRHKGCGVVPKSMSGRYTTEGEAKHAILLDYRKREYEANYRPNGRPKVKFRGNGGVRVGDVRGSQRKKKELNGSS